MDMGESRSATIERKPAKAVATKKSAPAAGPKKKTVSSRRVPRTQSGPARAASLKAAEMLRDIRTTNDTLLDQVNRLLHRLS
jgi:hypothetical protein